MVAISGVMSPICWVFSPHDVRPKMVAVAPIVATSENILLFFIAFVF